MKKNMLKLAFFGLMLFALSFNANAQMRIGGGILFSTESVSSIGLDVRLETTIGESLVIAPSFNYFLKKDGVTVLEFNGDLHYPFAVTEAATVYPLAGLNVTRLSFDTGFGSASGSEVGLNLGGGANFGISDAMKIFAELKYVLLFDAGGYNPLIFGGGILFDIGG